MKEKLIIKNFGPIKSVELELGRFNVLIGEQATGKSTVAKVLAVCRYFSYVFGNSNMHKPFTVGLEAWGLSEALREGSYIYYKCNHYSFSIENKTKKIPQFRDPQKILEATLTSLSPEFSKLLPENYESTHEFGMWAFPVSFYQNEVAKVMDNPFYLPTERGLQSIFSLGKSTIQNISDSLFNQFARMDQIVRLFKADTTIEPLNIIYKNEDGKGYIRKNNEDTFFSLYNAASGYQSTIPIVLLIKYYNETRKKKKTFIIEEPEQNLFPTAQYELIKFFADKIKYNNGFLLTTHSPYILSSLNNLMYAYTVGQNNHEDGNKIIEEKYWVNPDEVSAYQLLTDGTCVNILDKEERMIESDKIDEVSRIINKEFDDLMNIEFTEK